MRIAIMGSGGVGGYLGARLAAGGHDVAFVARGAHLEAMRTRGLRLESALGDVSLENVTASDDPGAIGPVDAVLLTVKLYDVEAAANACRPLLGDNTFVVTFQNGVESADIVGRVAGTERVLGGVAQIAALIAEPGLIRHTGIPPFFIFGERDGARSERAVALTEALTAAGVDAKVSESIDVDLWRKMVFLSSLAGMTSLIRLPIGPIRSDAETRAMLESCVREAFAVARARRVALADDIPDQVMRFIDNLPESNRSSMMDDLEGGRRLELPWLNGAIVRFGRELGLPTPTHAFIATALRLHAGGRR